MTTIEQLQRIKAKCEQLLAAYAAEHEAKRNYLKILVLPTLSKQQRQKQAGGPPSRRLTCFYLMTKDCLMAMRQASRNVKSFNPSSPLGQKNFSNTTMNTQKPDYGEPWKMLSREVGDFMAHPAPHDTNNKQVCDPYRNGLVEECQKRAERIVACVNALAGVPDPAAELARLRRLDWTPVTERLPTQEDADQFGDVEWSEGECIWQGHYKFDDKAAKKATHWRPITLP